MSGCPKDILEADQRTTAEWRTLAQKYEDALDWGPALIAWQIALERYPKRALESASGKSDRARILKHVQSLFNTHYRESHKDYVGKTEDGRRSVVCRHPLGWSELVIEPRGGF